MQFLVATAALLLVALGAEALDRGSIAGGKKHPGQGAVDEQQCTPGYDPCIPPGPDVDCAGGSGDGPRFVEGPIRVTGSDPYRLDRDHDGIGCE